MLPIWWRRSAFVLVLGAFACSSTTSPPAGGGGTGGTGGTNLGGTSGGSGAAGTGGVTPLPSCLQALQALCPTDGPCGAPTPNAGGFVRACSTGALACADAGSELETKVYKADGSLCYTLQASLSPAGSACETTNYTWTDGSGVVVATGEKNFDGSLVIGCGNSTPVEICRGVASPSCPDPITRLSSACACGTP